MQFKYKNKLDELEALGCQCPPQTDANDTRKAYRWVHKPMTNECFTPQALRNPRRLTGSKSLEDECSCWGLSMHTSYTASINHFKCLASHIPNIRKLLGSHVAEGRLDKISGVWTKPDQKNGHFDLHPSVSFDWKAGFSILEKIE